MVIREIRKVANSGVSHPTLEILLCGAQLPNLKHGLKFYGALSAHKNFTKFWQFNLVCGYSSWWTLPPSSFFSAYSKLSLSQFVTAVSDVLLRCYALYVAH
jgi:hypothetical protein